MITIGVFSVPNCPGTVIHIWQVIPDVVLSKTTGITEVKSKMRGTMVIEILAFLGMIIVIVLISYVLNLYFLSRESFIPFPESLVFFFELGIAKVEMLGKTFRKVEIEASQHIPEILIGRQLLNLFDIALLGSHKQSCTINLEE